MPCFYEERNDEYHGSIKNGLNNRKFLSGNNKYL
jgi:hypothetical protein